MRLILREAHVAKESVRDTAVAEPAMTCRCGNGRAHEGFYTCDEEGRRLGGGNLLCCDRCGRIIDRISGQPVGTRAFYAGFASDSE